MPAYYNNIYKYYDPSMIKENPYFVPALQTLKVNELASQLTRDTYAYPLPQDNPVGTVLKDGFGLPRDVYPNPMNPLAPSVVPYVILDPPVSGSSPTVNVLQD